MGSHHAAPPEIIYQHESQSPHMYSRQNAKNMSSIVRSLESMLVLYLISPRDLYYLQQYTYARSHFGVWYQSCMTMAITAMISVKNTRPSPASAVIKRSKDIYCIYPAAGPPLTAVAAVDHAGFMVGEWWIHGGNTVI
jgi:hypothetical protein